MRELTYILPAASILFVLFIFVEYVRARRAAGSSVSESIACPDRFEKKDLFLIVLISVVYACIAFYNLGDTEAPESNYVFPEKDHSVIIELSEPVEVGHFSMFTGYYPGRLYVFLSENGTDWSRGILVENSVSSVLKWKDVEIDESPGVSRFIRLLSDSKVEIGEFSVWDNQGSLLSAEMLSYSEDADALFDEQELVPAGSTYMNSSYFDEIYHVRTAQEHIQEVKPYEITHPPLGKLIIGLGIRLFGLTPFGWRFMGTLFGVLMLPIMYVFLMILFRRRNAAVCGSLLFAFDFMHFVQTRIATIDTYSVFFILLMYLFMYIYITADREDPLAPRWKRILPLFLSGLSFGLGAASKWTCFYAGAGLAVIWFHFWFVRGRELKEAGQVCRWRREFLAGVGQCMIFFVAIPVIVYYVSYWPYGKANGLSGFSMLFSGDYAKIVWNNQIYMWEYHSDLVADHPYSSRWYQWILDIRPILYYLKYYEADTLTARFGAFTNPLLCWLGLLAVLATARQGLFRGDKTARFIFFGYMAQLLPWIPISRLTFAYHYFPCMVFLTMAVCYILVFMWENRKRWAMYSFTAVSLGAFVLFWPVLTGAVISSTYSHHILQWLPSWPF